MANSNITLKLLNAFIWGFGRQLGNSLAKTSTQKAKQTVVNSESKFRKRIETFDMGGDFTSATKKLTVLIEMFHEEYVINKATLPLTQRNFYLKSDFNKIVAKLKLYKSFMSDKTQLKQFNSVITFWNNVVAELNKSCNIS